jgi:hypothetical protein
MAATNATKLRVIGAPPRTRASTAHDRAASADAYRAVAARLGIDADAVLHGRTMTPERDAVLDAWLNVLGELPTSYLIAWLPIMANMAAKAEIEFKSGGNPWSKARPVECRESVE